MFSASGNQSNDARDAQELLLFHLNIVLNIQKNRYLTQTTQKIQTVLVKFNYPKKALESNLSNPKTPSIISIT